MSILPFITGSWGIDEGATLTPLKADDDEAAVPWVTLPSFPAVDEEEDATAAASVADSVTDKPVLLLSIRNRFLMEFCTTLDDAMAPAPSALPEAAAVLVVVAFPKIRDLTGTNVSNASS
jgi:hypothetical protein